MKYKKYITFSFDDGVTQDIRLIKLLDKYNLQATFNLNSSLLGLKGEGRNLVTRWDHIKVLPSQIAEIYKNHEIGVHTLTHPNLTNEEDETVIYQVEQDRLNLETLSSKRVVGMAYPCGGENNNERVAKIIKEKTGVLYARTIQPTYSFELPKNIYRLDPTVHVREISKMYKLAKEYILLETTEPSMFYIWGHSYELDIMENGWEDFEDFCALISAKNDILYGTNTKVLSELGLI